MSLFFAHRPQPNLEFDAAKLDRISGGIYAGKTSVEFGDQIAKCGSEVSKHHTGCMHTLDHVDLVRHADQALDALPLPTVDYLCYNIAIFKLMQTTEFGVL